jgi:hypothetical protein
MSIILEIENSHSLLSFDSSTDREIDEKSDINIEILSDRGKLNRSITLKEKSDLNEGNE